MVYLYSDMSLSPVVQIIICLTKFAGQVLVSLLVYIKSSVLIFLGG